MVGVLVKNKKNRNKKKYLEIFILFFSWTRISNLEILWFKINLFYFFKGARSLSIIFNFSWISIYLFIFNYMIFHYYLILYYFSLIFYLACYFSPYFIYIIFFYNKLTLKNHEIKVNWLKCIENVVINFFFLKRGKKKEGYDI